MPAAGWAEPLRVGVCRDSGAGPDEGRQQCHAPLPSRLICTLGAPVPSDGLLQRLHAERGVHADGYPASSRRNRARRIGRQEAHLHSQRASARSEQRPKPSRPIRRGLQRRVPDLCGDAGLHQYALMRCERLDGVAGAACRLFAQEPGAAIVVVASRDRRNERDPRVAVVRSGRRAPDSRSRLGQLVQIGAILRSRAACAYSKQAIKDPFVLEFLNLKDEYCESELEEGLIQHLADSRLVG